MKTAHPPVGTYPPDEATAAVAGSEWQLPPPPQFNPGEPQGKPRRVGTITLAIGLIAVGVLMVLRIFLPNLDYLFIARLSPLLLVAYGLELLLAGLFVKDRPIKYDIVGFFLVGLLVCFSLAAAALPELVLNQRAANSQREALETELESITYDQLADAGIEVARVDWYINYDYAYTQIEDKMSLGSLMESETYMQVRIRFLQNFESKDAFAKAAREALDTMGIYAERCDYAIFYSYNYDGEYGEPGEPRMALWLETNHQVQFSAEQIAKQVEANYHVPAMGGYVDEEDYLEYLENPSEYENRFTYEYYQDGIWYDEDGEPFAKDIDYDEVYGDGQDEDVDDNPFFDEAA